MNKGFGHRNRGLVNRLAKLVVLPFALAAMAKSFAPQCAGSELHAPREHTEKPGVGNYSPQIVDTTAPVTGYLVRVAYVVPTNRTAQPNAIANLRNAIVHYQGWYLDQMERNGFGPKTFNFETEADGVTPKINLITVAETDSTLREDVWNRTIKAAAGAGIPVWSPKQVWWLVPEVHLEAVDGSISGGIFLGASFGSGDDPGVAVVASDALARYRPSYFTNDAPYAGQIIAEVGAYPLVQNVSLPWFEGTTLSSIASAALGGALHEISHGFGQPHDFRNDNNFSGNLMGNGLRGFRGALFPERYRTDYTRLSYGSALSLNVSRYFNSARTFDDATAPTLNVSTSGKTSPVNGQMQIHFKAADAGGLAVAWLMLDEDLISEMPLSGTSTTQTFTTPYYTPGESNRYTICVFDAQGNKQSADTVVIPRTGYNRAPQASFSVSRPAALAGEELILDASASSDPDDDISTVEVEWDLNGDGVFDTAPTTSKILTNRFFVPGFLMIQARLTDSAGAQSVSAPVAVQIRPAPVLSLIRPADQMPIARSSAAAGFGLEKTSLLAPAN